MQIVITAIVLLGAISFASWQLYGLLKGDADPCSGCDMKKNCQKFGHSKKK